MSPVKVWRPGKYRWLHKRTGLPVVVTATTRFKSREGWMVNMTVDGEPPMPGWIVPATELEDIDDEAQGH